MTEFVTKLMVMFSSGVFAHHVTMTNALTAGTERTLAVLARTATTQIR